MLGLHVRPALNRVLTPVATALSRAGVSADAITVVGTAGVMGGALGYYPRGELLWGTVFITCFVFSDLLDGAVARVRGTQGGPWGAFLDSTLDRFGDAAIFGGLVLWYAGGGHSRVMAAVTLFDLAAALVISYIKARAEGLGMTCNVGLAERAERLIAVLAAAGLSDIFDVPGLLVVTLWVLAGAMLVTVGQRFVEVHRQATAVTTP